ncbi:MAG: hypothetical protein QOF48_226 [Verrucomicrobiota bacterium]|jgi:hypothetical protein
MIAYPDGTEAHVGDAVALAHGAHMGRVTYIIESAVDVGAWNLDEPGLMIGTSYGGAVFYPKHSLTDDEIVLASRSAT